MELFTMSATEITRTGTMERLAAKELTQAQAGLQLGLSVRQIKRLWRRFSSEGALGMRSRRRGKPSNRRIDPQAITQILQLVADHYPDFGPTFAAEKLRERHDLTIDHETLRRAMIAAGRWTTRTRKRIHVHPPRERRLRFGELAQIDGSHHAWFEKRGPKCTLHVDVDDATSSLLALHFDEQETTLAYFEMVRQHALEYGLPTAFYSDKFGVFRINDPHGSDQLTQFGRAMEELGIELICANSPQAKGRVERANGTLQARLVREMRLRNISTIQDANAYVPEFMATYNAKFAKLPASDVDAHRTVSLEQLDRHLTITYQRTVTKNLTVQLKNAHYELLVPEQARRLRHVTVLLRRDRAGNLTIERNGVALPYRLARITPATPIRNAKEIATLPVGKRLTHPEKARMPAETHPWRTTLLTPSPTGHF